MISPLQSRRDESVLPQQIRIYPNPEGVTQARTHFGAKLSPLRGLKKSIKLLARILTPLRGSAKVFIRAGRIIASSG